MLGGGGFSAGKVTEVCGPPGLGKTQIGMQACVNVQLPEVLGGAGGEALYVDTEGSFIIERVAEIAAAAERLMATDPRAADIPPPPVSTLLSRIHILRIHSPTAQVALTHQLPSFLSTHRNIKLIIIDSIAFHFRQAFSQADMPLRARLLNTTAQTLRRCAEEFTCAVVVMNQMTTKVGGEMGTGEGDAVLVPALGATWGHACTNRVILFWDQGVRRACLVKSPSLPERTVGFCITSEGVRDVPPSLPPPDNPRKRHHDD
ncbi:RecA bacterial DNA recombination protein [Fimicolochytrium jonesii]|uniref:RecA bacterial DNA recombination protein n=1 Tax=Fimicolochytrium jonesii TaxID=1396493 RepID=UPI0022FF08F6|nr:RecA bacterial DNA recombination protein [Fimicolochytrium jonesii]KAI8823357.1 RecA bacterial DNA recombination protein [Fimicolochytrium jonesii]